MRTLLVALVLLVAEHNTAQAGRQRTASCRALCGRQIDACVATLGFTPHRCRTLVLRRCKVKGLAACHSPTTTTVGMTTTTTLTAVSTTTLAALTTTSSSPATTSTTLTMYPLLTGHWSISQTLNENSCGGVNVIDVTQPVTGPLVIVGPMGSHPSYFAAQVGPLTNLNLPIDTFVLYGTSSVGILYDEKFGLQSIIDLHGWLTCDLETGCCIGASLSLYGRGDESFYALLSLGQKCDDRGACRNQYCYLNNYTAPTWCGPMGCADKCRNGTCSPERCEGCNAPAHVCGSDGCIDECSIAGEGRVSRVPAE